MKQSVLFSILSLCTTYLIHTNQTIKISETGYYDRSTKTATLDNQTYIGVIEYNQAVTPPNLSNPLLVKFATIPTSDNQQLNKPRIGEKQAITTLWGIPVKGDPIAITTISSHVQVPFASEIKSEAQVVGFYWPKSKIARLNNGNIYVHVIEHSQATTPPNITNPEFVIIKGTIVNQRFNTNGLLGAQTQKSTLYGIPLKQKLQSKSQIQPMLKTTQKARTKKIKITGNHGEKGKYDKQNKTAWLQTKSGKKYYSQVVEYSQPVTPPTVSNPKMIAFATMPNPNYKAEPQGFVGGPMKNIILFGIPQNTEKAITTLKKLASIKIPQ